MSIKENSNPYLFFNDNGKSYKAIYVVSFGGIALNKKNKNGKYYQINANTKRSSKLIEKHDVLIKLNKIMRCK